VEPLFALPPLEGGETLLLLSPRSAGGDAEGRGGQPGRSVAVDLDPLRPISFRTRQLQVQHALVQLGLDCARVEAVADLEAALRRTPEHFPIAVAAIRVVVARILAGLRVVLGPDPQPSRLDGDFNVVLSNPGSVASIAIPVSVS